MKEFLYSLLSRKFLLALATAVICFLNKDWNGLIAVVSIYCGLNVVDAKLNTSK